MYLSVEEMQNLIKKEKQKWLDLSKVKGVQAEHLHKVGFYALKSLSGLEQEITLHLKKKYNIK